MVERLIGNRSGLAAGETFHLLRFSVSLLNVRRPIKIISDETNETGFTDYRYRYRGKEIETNGC